MISGIFCRNADVHMFMQFLEMFWFQVKHDTKTTGNCLVCLLARQDEPHQMDDPISTHNSKKKVMEKTNISSDSYTKFKNLNHPQIPWSFICGKKMWNKAFKPHENVPDPQWQYQSSSIVFHMLRKKCILVVFRLMGKVNVPVFERCTERCWHRESAWTCISGQHLKLSWRKTEWLPDSWLRNAAQGSPTSASLYRRYFSERESRSFSKVRLEEAK